MDLSEWLEAGRWRHLVELVDQLPAACRLHEAMANDPESAEYMAAYRLEHKGEGDEWAPAVREFDLNAHMQREIIHLLKQIKQNIVASAGGKPGDEKPFPAPRTAIDIAVERLEREWTVDFLGQFGFDAEDI